jgi:hypothetical protein
MWTIDEAVQTLERTFPNLTVTVADGACDYLVGTIEDEDESIVASFQLLLGTSKSMVKEIRIADGDGYCGYGIASDFTDNVSHVVPIQITRRDEVGVTWGLVGDYEVCVKTERIETR